MWPPIMTDLDAILSQLAEGHWPRPTAELGRAIVERIRDAEAENERVFRGMVRAHYELAAADEPDTLWLMDLLAGLLAKQTADDAAAVARKRDLPAAGERIRGLETENRRLTHQLRQERERRQSVERRHRNLVKHVEHEVGARQHRDMQLDALLMVWCSGGCGGGVLRWAPSVTTGLARWWHRRPEVTEEIVAFAELNTKRLRTWFENNKNKPLPPAAGEGGTGD
jgi:hypothetical protein